MLACEFLALEMVQILGVTKGDRFCIIKYGVRNSIMFIFFSIVLLFYINIFLISTQKKKVWGEGFDYVNFFNFFFISCYLKR